MDRKFGSARFRAACSRGRRKLAIRYGGTPAAITVEAMPAAAAKTPN